MDEHTLQYEGHLREHGLMSDAHRLEHMQLAEELKETAQTLALAVRETAARLADSAREVAIVHAREHEKADIYMNKRLDGMNEFRDQLREQAATFQTRESADLAHKLIEDKIAGIQKWVDGRVGVSQGMAPMVTVGTSVLTAVIVAVVVAFVMK